MTPPPRRRRRRRLPTTVLRCFAWQGVELMAHGANGDLIKVKAEEALAGKNVALYFSAHWCVRRRRL